jgi:hypothetical protein
MGHYMIAYPLQIEIHQRASGQMNLKKRHHMELSCAPASACNHDVRLAEVDPGKAELRATAPTICYVQHSPKMSSPSATPRDDATTP